MSCDTVLKEKGMKLTPQRRLIIDMLHTKAHLTAEEIIDHVQAAMPGINKSTVYRTLDLLEENGCVFKSKLGDRHVFHHAEEGHHHHLLCRKCGKNIECNEDLFSRVAQEIEEKYGFRADLNHLVMKGLCADCRKRK